MSSLDLPEGLRVDSFDLVKDVFVVWAGGRAEVKGLWTPDPLLAVESAHRRGFLLDEIYFATVWADHGRSELITALSESFEVVERGSVEPNPFALIHRVMSSGKWI